VTAEKQELRAAGRDKRQMAYTAAAMYGGAGAVALIEGVVPGGPELSLAPGLFALVIVSLLAVVGPRLPMPVLTSLGPLGAAMIAYAIATTPTGQGEGALLYIWPVLWVAYFFERTASILIVAWVGLVQGIALIASDGVLDRWIDVVVSVAIVAAVVQALSERNKRLVARLEAEARVDQLTGVLNRRGFAERAPGEVERAVRDGSWLAAVSFDIDHFKRVNDEFGHEVGDRVLAHLGAVLRAETRSVDVVARLGGEEFTTLLAGSDARRAFAYAERVRHHFADLDDPGLPRVTVSAGIAAAVAPESVERLLADADSALYKAKRAGRDRAVADQPAALQVAG
jgi:diguanylate cyclase (GGDEF)-like protein